MFLGGLYICQGFVEFTEWYSGHFRFRVKISPNYTPISVLATLNGEISDSHIINNIGFDYIKSSNEIIYFFADNQQSPKPRMSYLILAKVN